MSSSKTKKKSSSLLSKQLFICVTFLYTYMFAKLAQKLKKKKFLPKKKSN